MHSTHAGSIVRVDVTSICPIVVASIAWQPRLGLHALTVVAKATFKLQPGISSLAEHQDAIAEDDNHWNDDPSCSLHISSDLVPFKALADVILVGHAFSPTKEPVSRLTARLAVAEIDKRIDVWTDRVQLPDGTVREGAPFVKMPLRYERAAQSPTNPVGVRHEQRADRGGIPLPNLQPHGAMESRVDSIGFGPIAPSWAPRVTKAPHPIAKFVAHWFEQAMPDGFEPSFFNAAPTSQQVNTLRPDERILLESLHPEYPLLETMLPGIVPQATIERAGSTETMRMAVDTLTIDTERGVCSLTWRGQTRLAHPDEPGQIVVSMVEPPGFENKRRVTDTALLPPALPRQPITSEPARQPSIPDLDRTLQPITRGSAPLPFSANTFKQPDDIPPARVSQPTPLANTNFKHGETLLLRESPKVPEPLPFGKTNPPAPAPERPVAAVEIAISAPALVQAPPLIELPPPPAPPPLTIGQVVASTAAAQPPPTKQEAPQFFASSVVTSSPSGNAGDHKPSIGSVAALREAGRIPSADPRSAHGFSNAAALPEMRVVSLDVPAPAPSAPRHTTSPVEVLWFDETFVEPIRKASRLAAILEAQRIIREEKAKQDRKTRTKSSVGTNQEPNGKTDVATILSSPDPSGPEGLNDALHDAIDDRGTFTPPLVFMGGTLEFPFDELEILKATVAAITPMAAGDKKLNDHLATMNGFMRTSWLQGSTSERLMKELKNAFTAANGQVPMSSVEAHVERLLLEQRHYQKRVLLGQTFLRTLLTPLHSNARIPTYIPQQLARELPMFQRFEARVIVEARPQLDQYETSPMSLRVVALGRILTGLPKR